ncbi:hypothetical protein PTKIN_Ptkin09bG0237200 [Pterospermum kingtungense]
MGNDELLLVFQSGLSFLVGNGRSIDFWSQVWIQGTVLKQRFPRIYAFALNKSGNVNDYGRMVGNQWSWEIPLRRRLFGWEEQQWNEFWALISDYFLCESRRMKSYGKDLNEKLATKSELVARGLMQEDQAMTAVWGKAAWPKIVEGVEEIARWPNLIKIPVGCKGTRRNICWINPPRNALKFNVDGSFVGSGGLSGIGGILRDSEANPKVVFSKSTGMGSANTAEILAIRCAASQWASSHNLIIESDSTNAVKWVLNPGTVPWQVRCIILQIEFFKTKVQNWSIVHTHREANDVADNLAKDGVFRN